jgi:hypothetical protein
MKEGYILWSAESSREGIVVSDRRKFQCGGGKDRSVLPPGASALAASEPVYIRAGISVIGIAA